MDVRGSRALIARGEVFVSERTGLILGASDHWFEGIRERLGAEAGLRARW